LSYSKYPKTSPNISINKLTNSDIPGMCRDTLGMCRESQCECIEYVRKLDNTQVLRYTYVPPII